MAIALVTRGGAGSGLTGQTSFTFSLDSGATGADRVMVVGFWSLGTGYTINSVTYAGSAMTPIGTFTADSSRKGAMYAIAAPATGSNNLVINLGSAIDEMYLAFSVISGAKQTGLPDSTNSSSAFVGTAFSISTTVVENDSWLFMMTRNSGGGATSGADTTFMADNTGDITDPPTSSIAMFSSNGAAASGSRALNISRGVSATWGGVIASFAPVASANTIKDINSIAWVNIKNRNGVATGN